MDTTAAVKLFRNNWFRRNEADVELTSAEAQLIAAAMGPAPQRWSGAPEVERLEEILADEPAVLDRIGAQLLQVVIGMKGCGPAVQLLLDRDVPLDINETEYNVLHEAAWGGMTDTLRAVFESSAADATGVSVRKPHTGWPDNLSLMYWAAWGGYAELAELLIRYGVGVHHELPIKGNGERGTTSLQEAAAPSHWDKQVWRADGKREVARLLIADGAYYDIYSACAFNDTDRLRELLDHNPAVMDTTDGYGLTPLHWAARAGAMECAELLVAEGAAVNALNKSQRTPLQLAAEKGQSAMVRCLAKHGADLSTRDKKGRTPLHRAMYEGRVAAAEALLAAGADPMVPNKRGKNAFEIARKDAKHFRARA